MIMENLPLIFAGLLGLSILVYVVLDGFDLGVGLLFPFATHDQRDRMVASIGPFWDANETWLVLAVGILLVAFPAAHGAILTALYLPVFVMLVGLILRGVAFEFRAKAPPAQKTGWDVAFWAGSLMASLSQGYMLGMYIMGLTASFGHVMFALLIGVLLTIAYSFIGAVWLIAKTEGALLTRAIGWAQGGIWGAVLGIAAVSLATPLVSTRIADKWFSLPEALYLAPLPLASLALMGLIFVSLRKLRRDITAANHWTPFVATSALFALGFCGMAYSFYPYIVPEKMTIAQAASAPESLIIILWGVIIVLPMIIAYSTLSYVIFRGKAQALRYD
jgi:cytochrome bd ubiquinol oxidase subunit II